MLKITNAKFITSAARIDQFIRPNKPMIAVCGKSNVGKSSFINALAGQSKLAKTSSEPGRTRLVNYFDFGKFILADLPGYGYAKVSKVEKERWAKILEAFFAQRENIAHVISLMDIRHDPTEDDKVMINYLYCSNLDFSIVATKSDKLSKMKAKEGAAKIAKTFSMPAGSVTAFSSENGAGKDQVLSLIDRVILAYNLPEIAIEPEEDAE